MRVSDVNAPTLTYFAGFGSDRSEAPSSRPGPDRPPPRPTPVDVDLAAVVNAHIAEARSFAVDADARFDASWLIADTAAQLASFDDQLAQLRGAVQSNIVASNELGRKSEVLSLIQAALSNKNIGTDDAFALEKLNINLGGNEVSAATALKNVDLLEMVQPKE